MKELYKILGVQENATPAEIQKQYKKKALELHPDKPGGSKEKFNALKIAKEILSDEKKRKEYDAGLIDDNGNYVDNAQNINFDIFSGLFGGFSNGFANGFFGEGGDTFQHNHQPPPSNQNFARKNIEIEVGVPIGIYFQGSTQEIQITRNIDCVKKCKNQVCKECGGKGVFILQTQGIFMQLRKVICQPCGGKGFFRSCGSCKDGQSQEKYTCKLEIPPAFKKLHKIIIKEKGNKFGESFGDVIITLTVRGAGNLKIEGDNLVLQKSITLGEALSGIQWNFKHPNGKIYNLSTIQENGEVNLIWAQNFQMKCPNLGVHQCGDLVVQFIVQAPNKISPEMSKKISEVFD